MVRKSLPGGSGCARNLTEWNASDLQQRILSTVDGIETVEARLPVAGKDMGYIRFQYTPAQP